MSSLVSLRSGVLTEAVRAVLLRLPGEIRSHYAMGGGTALGAFYFGHRRSEDLDFFSLEGPVAVDVLKAALSKTGLKFRLVERIHDRRIFEIEGVKVEFVPTYFRRLHPPRRWKDFYVEDLEDILANKLIVLTDRTELKDWVDLAFALRRGFTPEKILQLAVQKAALSYEYTIDFDGATERVKTADLSFLIEPMGAEEIIKCIGEFRDLLVSRRVQRTLGRRR